MMLRSYTMWSLKLDTTSGNLVHALSVGEEIGRNFGNRHGDCTPCCSAVFRMVPALEPLYQVAAVLALTDRRRTLVSDDAGARVKVRPS